MGTTLDQNRVGEIAHDALGITVYPGTEIMTDVGALHLQQSGAGKHTLVPQPSHDPHDPLNWSRTWKWLTMSSMALSTFNWVFSPLSLAPQVPYYIESFDSTLPAVINFIGVSILVLGFTNLIWIPLSRGFGRRPMAIVTTLITTASCIWRAKATNYDSFLGAAVLCGIGASPGETLGPVIIADITFLHERGRWMGLYQWAFWSGLMIGPILAGVMAQDDGWRSFWWLSTAISVFTNVWIVVFLPETKWDRRAVAARGSVHGLPHPEDQSPKHLPMDIKIEHANSTDQSTPPTLLGVGSDTQLDHGKPNKSQMLPLVGWKAHEPVLDAIVLPFKLVRFPIVIWGALQFTFSASCYLMLNITQSQVFAAPPFHFTPAQVGYSNLATFVGSSISLLVAGPLSDWMCERATTKNGGVREPEMRLPALVPFFICTVLGCVIVSLGFQYGWPWEVCIIIGFTLIGIQAAAVSGIAINYVVDCYKPAAGEFLVCATVFKNVWGYGMTKFLNGWIVQIGYIGPMMTIAALNLGFMLFGGGLLFFFGKQLRGWSARSTVHTVS